MEIGDVIKAEDLGKKGHYSFICVKCPECQELRWVSKYTPNKYSGCCQSCSMRGERHWRWKGGRYKKTNGYVRIRLHPKDFFYPMVNANRELMEHRLIMAQSLGRCLHCWELVHHRNGIKDDNRIENLQLVTDDRHRQITLLECQINKLKQENQELKSKLRI